MKNNWIRLLAGALVSVVLVGAFALTGGMKSGKSTEGILYQASGLHPDGEMLAISGQTVTCEEYLFWLGMVCLTVILFFVRFRFRVWFGVGWGFMSWVILLIIGLWCWIIRL